MERTQDFKVYQTKPFPFFTEDNSSEIDLIGFGRRKIEIDPEDMYSMILYQVGALSAFLKAEGIPLNHIKPHGELFFYMQRDLKICEAVLRACAVYGVPVYGSKGAEEEKEMCEKMGLIFVEEAYTDLQYDENMKLLSAAMSKMATVDDIYERAISIGMDDEVVNSVGQTLKVGFNGQPFSFCIHSDMPTALDNAKVCRKAVNEINAKRGWS